MTWPERDAISLAGCIPTRAVCVSDTAVSLLVPGVHRVSSSSPSSPSWVTFGAEDPLRPVRGAIAEADPKKLAPILAQHGGGPRIFQPLPIPLRKADTTGKRCSGGSRGDVHLWQFDSELLLELSTFPVSRDGATK